MEINKSRIILMVTLTICIGKWGVGICHNLGIWKNKYSRTPLLRPPLGLAICGRNRGVAVIQALEHVATSVCVAKHMYNIT